MANDLISRKALMQEIEKSMNNNPHTEPKVKVNHEQEHKHFMCLLSKQPTAYDVEKVVEVLQSLSNAEADYYYANSNDVIDRETAIDIVKNGGSING